MKIQPLSIITGIALLATCSFAEDAEKTEKPKPAKRLVMSWAAPYAMTKVKQRLNESYDGLGMKDGFTHLGLQFWSPTAEGGVARSKEGAEVTDAAVAEFRDWGRAHGVRVLLCVFNHVHKWDWALARSAFADHPKEFADALVAEMEHHDLDGVDLDLEGEGAFDPDKAAYVQFVTDLSAKLRAKGKHLTLDSFAYVWNAPNENWWKELFPLVDGITSMGYEQLGCKAPEWRAYSAQKAAAGENAAKLMIGMPTRDEWQGNPVTDHLDWVLQDGTVGFSFWDAQINGAKWRTAEVWGKIRDIKDGAGELKKASGELPTSN